MILTITPALLSGTVTPPPSKSLSHRMILADALAEGVSVINNVELNEDIRATLRCAQILGAAWHYDHHTLRITGCGGKRIDRAELPHYDCGESGSTLRFLIPIALALTGGGVFTGNGRLMHRPLGPYFDLFREKGLHFEQTNNTLTIRGTLKSGKYYLPGNVSSQFFTGLLYALPLTDGHSLIIPTTHLESADYIAMTIDVLYRAGISVGTALTLPPHFAVPGNCAYAPLSTTVEPDWSQAAFWYAVSEMGSSVAVSDMADESLQGDSIFPLWMAQLRGGGEITIDAAQYPDLVPPLAARAATMDGILRITNIGRLRMKESDRITAIAETLSAIGAEVSAGAERLTILGKTSLAGGVTVDCHGDHRIAMMLAVAATRCKKPITLTGAECVAKSYPRFWEDYTSLGGIIHEHLGE